MHQSAAEGASEQNRAYVKKSMMHDVDSQSAYYVRQLA